jgi:cyclic pyranopterin phosphate synthase
VRKDLCAFLRRLSAIPGLRQLVLTTNGLLLPEMARELKEAGVQRLNISLDSLRPDVFSRITRGGDLGRVREGIAAAVETGFPVKLNMVVMRGVNDDELADFAALTLAHPFAVRFIEYMPAIQEENWSRLVLPGEEILTRLAERFAFQPVARGELAGPAREFRIAGAAGSIGVITPLSGHFCGDCNRIRVAASGVVRSCLFADGGFDLKPLLRAGDPVAIATALRRIVSDKPAMHQVGLTETAHVPFAMSGIGG